MGRSCDDATKALVSLRDRAVGGELMTFLFRPLVVDFPEAARFVPLLAPALAGAFSAGFFVAAFFVWA